MNNYRPQQGKQPYNQQMNQELDPAALEGHHQGPMQGTHSSQGENVIVSDRVVQMLERQQNYNNGQNNVLSPDGKHSSMSSRLSRDFNQSANRAMQDSRINMSDDSLARASIPQMHNGDNRISAGGVPNQHDALLNQIGLNNVVNSGEVIESQEEEMKQGDWQQFSNQFNQLVHEDVHAADNMNQGSSIEYGNEDINEGQITQESDQYQQQDGQFENLQRGGFLDYVQEEPGEEEDIRNSNVNESQLKNGNDTIKEDLIENDEDEDEHLSDYEEEDMLVRPSPEDREFFRKNLDSFQSNTSSQVRRPSQLKETDESRDGSGQVGHRLQNKLGLGALPVTEELNPQLEESHDAPNSALNRQGTSNAALNKDKSSVSERYLQPAASGIINNAQEQQMQTESEDEPLFQLSIRLSADGEPEILKFYEGADPRQLAIDLQRKYPHVITTQKTVDLVERQIREGWHQVQRQIEQEQAEEAAQSSGMLRSRASANLHDHRNNGQVGARSLPNELNDDEIHEDEELNSMDESITQQVFRHGAPTGREVSEDEARHRRDHDSKHVLIETPSSHQQHMGLAQKSGMVVKQVSEASAGIGGMPTDLKESNYTPNHNLRKEDISDYPMRLSGQIGGYASNADEASMARHESFPQMAPSLPQAGQEQPMIDHMRRESNPRRRKGDRSTSPPVDRGRLGPQLFNNQAATIDAQRGGASQYMSTGQQSPNIQPMSSVYQRQTKAAAQRAHIVRGGKKRAYSQSGPGSRLYYNAIQMAEKKRKRQQDSREEQEHKEMEDASFQPQLVTNPRTRLERLPNARFEDYLLYRMAERDRKLERLREQKEKEMMMRTNNFTPRINPTSARIDKLRSQGIRHAAQQVVDSEEQGKRLEASGVIAQQYRSVDNLGGSIRGSIVDIRNGGFADQVSSAPRGAVFDSNFAALPANSGGPAEALSGGEENIISDEEEGGILGAEQDRLSGRDRFRAEAYASTNDGGMFQVAGRQTRSGLSQHSAGSRTGAADRRLELYNMSQQIKKKREASVRAFWRGQNFTFQPNAHKYPEVRRGKRTGKSAGPGGARKNSTKRTSETVKVRAGFTKKNLNGADTMSQQQLGPKDGEIDDLAIGMFDGDIDYMQETSNHGISMLGGTMAGSQRPSSLGGHKKRYSTIQELEEEANGQPDVWQRMERRVDEFHLKRRRMDDPEAFEQVVMLDPKTGQPLFKPQILSSRTKEGTGRPSIRDELDPRHINEYLYRHGQIMRMKKQMKEELVRKQQTDEFQRGAAGASHNSRLIFERKLRGDLGAIFDQLSDYQNQEEARISARSMRRDALPPELLEVFAPLIKEMDEYGESLDRDEFIESSLVLLQSVNVHQRGLVMGYGTRRRRQSSAVEENLRERITFKPKISEASKQMARKFYERRQAHQEIRAKEKADKVGSQDPVERTKVDLRDPIKRFALNLAASQQHQEDLQRRVEEELSERCTFQPNTGRGAHNQSGSMRSGRSHYGGGSSSRRDAPVVKVQNMEHDSKRSSAAQQAYDNDTRLKFETSDLQTTINHGPAEESKDMNPHQPLPQRQSPPRRQMAYSNSSNGLAAPQEIQASPAQVGGASSSENVLLGSREFAQAQSKASLEEVRQSRTRYYEYQKKREENEQGRRADKLGYSKQFAPKQVAFEPRLRERRNHGTAQSVDAGDGRLLRFGDKRSPARGNAQGKTPITGMQSVGLRSGASSRSNLHRAEVGSGLRESRDEQNAWQDASGVFKGMLRQNIVEPAKKKTSQPRPGSSVGIPAATLKHMEQRAQALADARKASQGLPSVKSSRAGSKKRGQKRSSESATGPGPKRKMTAAIRKAGDDYQHTTGFDENELSPQPETRVPHPASGKRTAPQASPSLQASPPTSLNRRSKGERDRIREGTVDSGMRMEGGSITRPRPDRQHAIVSEILITQQFGKKSGKKDDSARPAADEGQVQVISEHLKMQKTPLAEKQERRESITKGPLAIQSPNQVNNGESRAKPNEKALKSNAFTYSARSAQSGGQAAQDDEVEIADATDREQAHPANVSADIPFTQQQLDSLDNTQMSLDEILQQNQRYSLGANLGALVSDRSKQDSLVPVKAPRFLKKSPPDALVNSDRTSSAFKSREKKYSFKTSRVGTFGGADLSHRGSAQATEPEFSMPIVTRDGPSHRSPDTTNTRGRAETVKNFMATDVHNQHRGSGVSGLDSSAVTTNQNFSPAIRGGPVKQVTINADDGSFKEETQ